MCLKLMWLNISACRASNKHRQPEPGINHRQEIFKQCLLKCPYISSGEKTLPQQSPCLFHRHSTPVSVDGLCLERKCSSISSLPNLSDFMHGFFPESNHRQYWNSGWRCFWMCSWRDNMPPKDTPQPTHPHWMLLWIWVRQSPCHGMGESQDNLSTSILLVQSMGCCTPGANLDTE